jgi:hypothetical protein
MKKILILAFFSLLLCLSLSADLLTAYKKGVIKIVPDPNFGAKTTWDMLFKAGFDKRITFLPDGSFFRTAYMDGKIYKFDTNGDKVAEFGRKGQGPGDLNGPVHLDVLDDKYLIIYEDGNRRLSQFDLDGKFIKTAKIESPGISMTAPVVSLLALKANKIAIVAQDQKSNFWVKNFRVLIKDMGTGAEKEIASFTDEKPQSPIFIKLGQFDGAVYLAKVGGNKLLIAYSKSPEIALYSFDGEKKSSFNIGLERVKIGFDHLEYVQQPEKMDTKEREGYEKVILANKDRIRLPEFHPYYLGLTVDPEDHILLFLNNLAKKTRDIAFQAYSLDGKLLATTKIDPGEYKLFDPSILYFHKYFLYASLEKTNGDGSQFLARIKIAD